MTGIKLFRHNIFKALYIKKKLKDENYVGIGVAVVLEIGYFDLYRSKIGSVHQ